MADDRFLRQVMMQCSTCGGTQFAFEEGGGPVRCVGCARTFERQELEAVKGEVVQDLRDRLRKSLSGSKHFKIK